MSTADFELRHYRRRPRPRPKALTIPTTTDGDFIAYTSLSDIISPNAVNSPSAASDIMIKNRLLKHAAYAYLQPTPSMDSASSRRRRHVSLRRAIRSCFGFITRFFREIV